MGYTIAGERAMKKHALLLVLFITPINAVIFSSKGGCGIFLALPLIAGWHLINMCCGPSFADNHSNIVAATGAVVGAC
jgi:hypothetical protein